MYERRYGYRYQETRGLSDTEIAKLIRADIKQAKAEGLLPTHWTYSVRCDGLAIDLDVKDCADAWEQCDGTGCQDVWCAAKNDPARAEHAAYHERLTADAQAAKMTLQRIHGAYNYDGSEIQTDYFDVRYYGIVQFEDASTAKFRAEQKAKLAAKKAAREGGRIVGRVKNFGSNGFGTTHVIVETGEGKQVLGCGARVWGSSFLVPAADDADVTCSRCAKRLAREGVTAG